MDDLKAPMREFIAKHSDADSIVRIRELTEPATGVIEHEFMGRDEAGKLELLFVARYDPAAR